MFILFLSSASSFRIYRTQFVELNQLLWVITRTLFCVCFTLFVVLRNAVDVCCTAFDSCDMETFVLIKWFNTYWSCDIHSWHKYSSELHSDSSCKNIDFMKKNQLCDDLFYNLICLESTFKLWSTNQLTWVCLCVITTLNLLQLHWGSLDALTLFVGWLDRYQCCSVIYMPLWGAYPNASHYMQPETV